MPSDTSPETLPTPWLASLWQQLKDNAIALLGLLIAIVGLTLNVKAIEIRELNSNYRTAAFQTLKDLTQLEDIVWELEYDGESPGKSPRTGWATVRLLTSLSILLPDEARPTALQLENVWSEKWEHLSPEEAGDADASDIIHAIEDHRAAVLNIVQSLN
jgi:hypothetical protein